MADKITDLSELEESARAMTPGHVLMGADDVLRMVAAVRAGLAVVVSNDGDAAGFFRRCDALREALEPFR